MLLVACEREARVVADSSRVMAPAAITQQPAPVQGKAECPATGLWSECAVFQRIERAGLAPRVDSAGATEPPLTPRGHLLRVGNSELELYIYPDAPSREREASTLDREKYVDHSAPLPMRPRPTLIQSANLIAILHSRNDHQRERVADAIAAGPPQPSRP